MSLLADLEPHIASIKTALMVAAFVGVAGGAAWVTHQVDAAHLAKIEEGWKDAQAKAEKAAAAIQHAEDQVSLQAAVDEAKKQQQIVTVTNTVEKEVPRYVPVASKCPVTWGFVRVLNAAVLRVDPAVVPVAAGQPDDACAPVDARAIAGSVIANYGACDQNAQQLTSLQQWVRATIAASKGTK